MMMRHCAVLLAAAVVGARAQNVTATGVLTVTQTVTSVVPTPPLVPPPPPGNETATTGTMTGTGGGGDSGVTMTDTATGTVENTTNSGNATETRGAAGDDGIVSEWWFWVAVGGGVLCLAAVVGIVIMRTRRSYVMFDDFVKAFEGEGSPYRPQPMKEIGDSAAISNGNGNNVGASQALSAGSGAAPPTKEKESPLEEPLVASREPSAATQTSA